MLTTLALAIMTATLPTTPAPLHLEAPAAPAACRARELVQLALARGEPLLEQGQYAASAAVYEVACVAILGLGEGELDETQVRRLAAARELARTTHDPVQRARQLRSALDEVDAILITHEAPDPDDRSLSLFEFDSASAPHWSTLNDDVMGGVSRSAFAFSDEGAGVFTGALSLENNGGFATIRAPESDLELVEYAGVRLRVRGDGRTYGFSAMRSARREDLGAWRKKFSTSAGTWVEIEIPFEAMVLNVMGKPFPDAGPIDPSAIRSFSFIIADKNEAPFRLEIDWIRAFRGVTRAFGEAPRFHTDFLDAERGASDAAWSSLFEEVHPRIYRAPVLDPAWCTDWSAEIERRATHATTSGRHVDPPNALHAYGVVLDDYGFQNTLAEVRARLLPSSACLFPEFGGDSLDSHHGFLVDYSHGRDEDLPFHVDDSEVTLNVCLAGEFDGSELTFQGLRCDAHRQTPASSAEVFEYLHEPGVALLHAGTHRHSVEFLRRGQRRNLILWCRSRAYRESRARGRCGEWCGARASASRAQ